MSTKNHQVLLASRPNGEPTAENFEYVENELPTSGDGQMLLRTIYLSLDPYMRGRMNAGPSYAAPVEIGDVFGGGGVAQVVESHLDQFEKGDIVSASTGWQEYSISDGKDVQKIDSSSGRISYALGVLGMPGLTAYTGLLNIGKPQSDETLVVAAASGAVGSVVGQIGLIKGCHVIGIAGGPEKCQFVKEELGFDDCLDHYQPDLDKRLKGACPDGIDVYYENVGGPVFDAVLPLLNRFARIPVCGLVAHYNDTELPPGPDRLSFLMQQTLTKRLTFRGFIVGDFQSQYDDFITNVSQWINDGKIKYKEDITDGLQNAPQELIGLLKGGNFGKKIIRVGDDPA